MTVVRSTDPDVYMLDLIVDDVTALATPSQFDRIMEYSCSLPTGTYAGKRWKRGEPYANPTRWLLGEYYDLPNDDRNIGIKWRELLVVT